MTRRRKVVLEELVDNPNHADAAIYDYLRSNRLLVDGHFTFSSGRHSGALLDRDRLLADPSAASRMGYALAKQFFATHIETIAAPSIFGVALAQWVAYFLEPRASVVYAIPHDGDLAIAGNLRDLIAERRVVLVDTVVTSDDSIAEAANLVERYGGQVIGLGTLWNAGSQTIGEREVVGLLNPGVPAYTPAACPQCSGASGSSPTAIAY